jgi:hypothetical protein
MPNWSRVVQYGAAIGLVIIVGVVAIQFSFSAELVLGLLAGVGVLLCASVFEGLPRAAMIGASAVLLRSSSTIWQPPATAPVSGRERKQRRRDY